MYFWFFSLPNLSEPISQDLILERHQTTYLYPVSKLEHQIQSNFFY